MAIAASYRQGRERRDYVRTQVETASQTQLILLLYDGAIRFLSLGRERMLARRIEEQNSYLVKAQRILGELISALDHEKGGAVAANLHRLYTYMLQQVVEANLHDQPETLAQVIDMLRELRASWEEIDRQARPEGLEV